MREARLAISVFASLGYAGPEGAAMNSGEETVFERLDELAAAGVDVDVKVGVVFDPCREMPERSVRCC